MIAKNITNQHVSGKRRWLYQELPLDTPYTIHIFPVYACNFKCSYCTHSILTPHQNPNLKNKIMDFDLYKKLILGLKEFPHKIKAIHFAGLGEPLIHKHISDMIKYAIDNDVAEIIDIVSNGVLLTNKLSDKLIASGLSRLRLSIQGINSDTYKEICDANIDFNMFVNNIKYFYDNRKKTELYIKILDCGLNDDNEKNDFFKIFGPICDKIAIESLFPIDKNIDYKKIFKKDFNTTALGTKVINTKICSQPFFSIHVLPDFGVLPCCSINPKFNTIANCTTRSLKEIWNSIEFKRFQQQMLDGYKSMKFCHDCNFSSMGWVSEKDILDDYSEKLKKLY